MLRGQRAPGACACRSSPTAAAGRRVLGKAMKIITRMICIAAVLAISGEAPAESRTVSLTVYANDLALVRDVRQVRLEKGVQQHIFENIAAQIEPASVVVHAELNGVRAVLRAQHFEREPVDTQHLLAQHVNRQVTVIAGGGQKISGVLLGGTRGDVVLQGPIGAVTAVRSAALERIEFSALPREPAAGPALVCVLDAPRAGNYAADISYLTQGLTWRADYSAVINETDTGLKLTGRASLDNRSGVRYADASVRLVAGDVHRAQPEVPVRVRRGMEMALQAAPPAQEQPFFEYHLYRLPHPITVRDGQVQQVALFDEAETPARTVFTYDASRSTRNVRVSLAFTNSLQPGPGMPLPAGIIRVYKAEADGSRVFVGEDRIEHTPAGEKVLVALGNAFDIVGERTLLESGDVDQRRYREKVEIRLRNRKDTDVMVTIIEHFPGDWKLLNTSVPVARQQARTAEFDMPVPREGEAVLTYAVMYRR
jgi:hypothetical protein